ncbi:uroporphyrin-III C-methyltransferase, partial [Priestia megaterium]
TKYQRTVTGTLATIEEIAKKAEIAHPAIVLVGEVVTIREKIKWFEERAENILL